MGQVQTQVAASAAATPTQVLLVANTSTLLVAANPERAQVVISVPAGSTITLGYGAAATPNGIIVVGGGAPFVESSWKGAIYAYGPAIDVNVMELDYTQGDPSAGNELGAGAEAFVPSGPSDGHPATDVPEFEIHGQ